MVNGQMLYYISTPTAFPRANGTIGTVPGRRWRPRGSCRAKAWQRAIRRIAHDFNRREERVMAELEGGR